jgi:glutaredoxin-related protein
MERCPTCGHVEQQAQEAMNTVVEEHWQRFILAEYRKFLSTFNPWPPVPYRPRLEGEPNGSVR